MRNCPSIRMRIDSWNNKDDNIHKSEAISKIQVDITKLIKHVFF